MAAIVIELTGLSTEIAELVCGKADLGATNAAAICRILTGDAVTLVDIELDTAPAFVASGDDFVAANVPKQGTAVASGLASVAQILDLDENVVFYGAATVIGGQGFAQLDKVEIKTSDVVTLQTLLVTGP